MAERTLVIVWRDEANGVELLVQSALSVFFFLTSAKIWAGTHGSWSSEALVPILLFAGITSAAGYLCAARWWNRTVLELGRDALSIRRGPLPWFGVRHIAKESLRTVGVRKHLEPKRADHYSVFGRLDGDERVTVTREMSKRSANRIADELAAWLEESSD